MGAGQSSAVATTPPESGETLREYVNRVATKFILSQDFQRIKDLTTEETCSKLVIMTSDLIAKYLDDAQIEFLTQHLEQGGQVVDKKTSERLVFFDKKDAQGETPTMGVQSRTKKTRMCIGIAQFYVKIFNLFAAVTTTANPQLAYTDPRTQKRVVVSLLDKNKIPQGVETRAVSTSFCSKRISALFGDSVSGSNAAEGVITIRPGICSLNESSSTAYPTVADEPGFPELTTLFNDKYNYSTGKFDSRSPAAEEDYQNAVRTMYRVFTGISDVPSSVRTFKDIPLAQYWRTPVCDKKQSPSPTNNLGGQNAPTNNIQISFPMPGAAGQYGMTPQIQVGGGPATGAFRQTYTGSMRVAVYANYAKHVATMMQDAANGENELLGILKNVFTSTRDSAGIERVSINPDLTHERIDKITVEARAKIGAYYAKCEQNFQTGIDLLEAVVQYQFAETAKNRGADLKKQLEGLNATN